MLEGGTISENTFTERGRKKKKRVQGQAIP